MNSETATEAEVEKVVNALWRDAGKLSSEQLLSLYKRYGGVAVFSRPKLPRYWAELRNVLMRTAKFPVKEYDELVLAMSKITVDDVGDFGQHPRAVASLEIFNRLWSVKKEALLSGVMFNETHALVSRPGFGAWMETLPVVHAPNCLSGVDVRDHYFCKTIRISHADDELKFMKQFQQDFQNSFHPQALTQIQDEALSLSTYSRERYAGSVLVRDDQWAALLTDKRDVLNAIARNRLLPEAIAYSIISAHKTPQLRISIARNAGSKELLDAIWHSTKSEAIRNAVAENALSERDPLETLDAEERRRLQV